MADLQIGALATDVALELTDCIAAGMPELSQQAVHTIVTKEIIPKTIAFGPALTNGEIDDRRRLGAFATAVGIMYWGDQTVDRGDEAMETAITLLGQEDVPISEVSDLVHSRLRAARRIQENVKVFTNPGDRQLVLPCFYDQVLVNEVRIRRLSQAYQQSNNPAAFLAEHAAEIAEISTISAGFPSISSSLHAIYWHHDRSLPSLSEIYAHPAMTRMLQTCNVIVRLWDDLGDWKMDTGYDPSKGVFVINPFNQYHPRVVRRFCELASIDDPELAAAIQHAFANFHASEEARQEHGAFVLNTLRDHIHQYMETFAAELPVDERERFDRYITLCKRVLEIGYVNRIGDIALAQE